MIPGTCCWSADYGTLLGFALSPAAVKGVGVGQSALPGEKDL